MLVIAITAVVLVALYFIIGEIKFYITLRQMKRWNDAMEKSFDIDNDKK